MIRKIPLLLFVVLIIISTSCEIFNPDEPIPAYLEIERFELDADTNSLGIEDVWVEVNGDFLGVFEVPAKLPIITNGKADISLMPGIKVNGINEQRSFYPFYEPHKTSLSVKGGEVYKIKPKTKHTDWVDFPLNADFEFSVPFIKSPHSIYNKYSDTTIVQYDADKYSGSYSGAICLNDTTFFSVVSDCFPIPNLSGSGGMYLELYFKSSSPAYVGYYLYKGNELVEQTPFYMVVLPKREEWTKVYLDLYSHLVKYLNTDYNYRIVLTNYKLEAYQNSIILLDDVKIVQSK